jgi:hypothetical protein
MQFDFKGKSPLAYALDTEFAVERKSNQAVPAGLLTDMVHLFCKNYGADLRYAPATSENAV